jgi:hypothetical protein
MLPPGNLGSRNTDRSADIGLARSCHEPMRAQIGPDGDPALVPPAASFVDSSDAIRHARILRRR